MGTGIAAAGMCIHTTMDHRTSTVRGLELLSDRDTTIGAIGVGDRQRQSSFGLACAGSFFENVIGHPNRNRVGRPTEVSASGEVVITEQQYQLLDRSRL